MLYIVRQRARDDFCVASTGKTPYAHPMRKHILLALAPIFGLFVAASCLAAPASATDACSTTAIKTAADVTVSDGSHYATETFYHTKDNTAFRLHRDNTTTIAVEGPFSWTSNGEKTESGGEFQKLFALGHQFHAILLHFDDIMENVRPAKEISSVGGVYEGISGDYPYGGVVHMIAGDDPAHPSGMVFEFPDRSPITTVHSDWRRLDGRDMPFRIMIDDGERVFDYRYTDVDLTPKTPLWFFDALAAPDLDEVQIYRLHRILLAAHCVGDAELMAEMTAPEAVIANRGDIFVTTPDQMRARFKNAFDNFDYSNYIDLDEPLIEISSSGDIAWAAVKVRAVGEETASGAAFDQQWAWVMLAKKIDGVWKQAGNASNRSE